MKQKTYEKPSVMVIELQTQSQLLVESVQTGRAGLQNYSKQAYEEE